MGRQKTLYEKALEILYVLVYGIGTMYLIENNVDIFVCRGEAFENSKND